MVTRDRWPAHQVLHWYAQLVRQVNDVRIFRAQFSPMVTLNA